MKHILKAIFSKILGLVIFLIIMFILNHIYLNIPLYDIIVQFLNKNLILLIALSFLFLITEIFYLQSMPFNLPAPLIASVAGVILTGFIFEILYLIGTILNISAFSIFYVLAPFVYILVFVFILIGGYISIFKFARNFSTKRNRKRE